MIKHQINKDSLVIIFNNQDNKYTTEIVEFIYYIDSKKIKIWSVAINKNSRVPNDIIKSK